MPQEPWFKRGTALGVALHRTTLHLTVLNALRYQHYLSPLSLRLRRRERLGREEPSSAGCGALLARQNFAVVHPNLDADGTHGGCSGGEAIIDLRTEGVQRHATLAIPLAAAHLSATQTTRALDTDALSAALAGGLNGLAHCATECDAAFELLSNGLSNEAWRRVQDA